MMNDCTPAIEKPYLRDLAALERLADEIPNTRLMAFGKVTTAVLLSMRWEPLMLDRALETHPHELVAGLVRDAAGHLTAWRDIGHAAGESPRLVDAATSAMEDRHRDLFQQLWVNFNAVEYQERIERFVHRLRVNGLGDGALDGRRCIDFGCGHGNFAHALLQSGASHVTGIDFGRDSITYASKARDALRVSSTEIEFVEASVYRVPSSDAAFQFAIQNGVFHHLEDEDAAYREVHRVLEPEGWFWIYTVGANSVSHQIWDTAVHILRDVPPGLIIEWLETMGVSTNKRYHLGDGLNATYRYTTWDDLTARLASIGFGNFRRLVGGFSTDFDHDVIEADRWGPEKFGEGDLRLLAQKIA